MAARRYAFVGGSADNIKKYRLPVGEFLHNMLQNQKAIISCMAVNEDGVLVSGADNGSLWCVRTGRRCFLIMGLGFVLWLCHHYL